MRANPSYAITDLQEAEQVVRAHPWATMISQTDDGPVASHYPFLLEHASGAGPLTLLSHVGRPDEELHRLGGSQLLVVFQGVNGYVSPSWAGISPAVPTWDFVTVHTWGTPEILTDEQNLEVLQRMVAHFEGGVPEPFDLAPGSGNRAFAEQIVRGTVGFRMPVQRWVGKRKLSQNDPPQARQRIVAALRGPGPYHHPLLADEIEREAGRPSRGPDR